MKIELNIPNWAIKARLIILSGTELVAQKLPWQDYWKIKEIRCNLCGKCCMNQPQSPFGINEKGWCNKLKKENNNYECIAGTKKPYMCLKDPINFNDCCITYSKVKA